MATGEIINWLNSDDYLMPGALSAIVRTWLEDPVKSVLCGHAYYINQESQQKTERRVRPNFNEILPGAPPLAGGVQDSWFLSRSAWDAVGGIDPEFSYIMDIDLFFRCKSAGIAFRQVDAYIAAYRNHEVTKTNTGWRNSIESKRQFYYRQLNLLEGVDKSLYSERVRRYLFGLFKNSISHRDPLHTRLCKLMCAIREYPIAVLKPYQIRQMIHLLLTGEM